jgi:hypothetical protein
MKRYIKTASSITDSDYKAALLLLRHSTDIKEIERAQEIIREFKNTNPELAKQIKDENDARRNALKHQPKSKSKYRW